MLADWADLLPKLLPGLWISLIITTFSMLLAVPLATLFAVGARSNVKPIRWTTITIVEVGRGMPGLVMLYLVYYGGPQIDISLSSIVAAIVGLALTGACYMSEIIRAGLMAVPRGQREASRALGLSPWKGFRLVIFPQALRIILPPLIGYGIIIFQATSLAFAISTPEMLSRAYNDASITFRYTAALTLAGALYAGVSLFALALIATPQKLASRRRDRRIRTIPLPTATQEVTNVP